MTPSDPAFLILRYWGGGLLYGLCTKTLTMDNVATWTMAAFGGAMLGAASLDLWRMWRRRKP